MKNEWSSFSLAFLQIEAQKNLGISAAMLAEFEGNFKVVLRKARVHT